VPTYTIRKANDSVLLSAFEEMIAALRFINTDKANILGLNGGWVTFNDIPPCSSSDIRERGITFGVLQDKSDTQVRVQFQLTIVSREYAILEPSPV
jgi:hypothetical protein